ncbi:alanine--tRNA ligase-related protein [Serratia plymuthica]|uniref:Alanine--tRNA ligase n=1 Tax=Serratia plymuthica TaxID=82996 RepID=A0A2X4V2C6_SERPL|nr:alanyl-tRNA editing protein [Serratia plymuthica]NIC27371.1 alanyl-tRNA editing protein [Serratia plymuthica]QPS20407.1 alanyl-tRNA editing protein [Serratia plymuthica]QPS58005.1 alanyl-tRNA editing protein [Serratia plymuthica]QPS62020.1 alanyl-tRNA editing protein [Serratia plymuthica]RKS65706.1 alanyl-tRNA synthetase [Serratia plymuthica]
MLKTKRLFDDKPYETLFESVVTHVGEGFIILEQTLFYPLSGNQNFDIGFINGHPVTEVHVESDSDGKLNLNAPIKHFIDTSTFSIGQHVRGDIDETRRIKTMRLHTASHLIEFFVKKLPYFLSVEGSFVDDVKDRTDYSLSKNIDQNLLRLIENQVNDFIAQAHSVSFSYQYGVRFWNCNGIEMPCCGTHVSNTKEIGEIRLSRKNKGKGLNRIEVTLV